VIDVATGGRSSPALADEPGAREARAVLPDPRFADVYVSRVGLRSLASGPRAPLAVLAPLIAPDASLGVAAAMVASDGALELSTNSRLQPGLPAAQDSALAALPGFTPTLAAQVPADSLAYLGVGHPGGALRRALGGNQGVVGLVAGLLGGLKSSDLTALARKLLPALGPEAALAVAPPALTAGLPSGPPQLELVARGVDGTRAKRALAGLQSRPPFDLSRSALLVASSASALADLKQPQGTLDSSPAFTQATAGLPVAPSLLAYLDLSGLLPLFESAGLAENPAYPSFAAELRRLDALGLAIQSAPSGLQTELRLTLRGGPSAGG
jgi:hypothetical protein